MLMKRGENLAKRLAKNKKILFLLIVVALAALGTAAYIRLSRPSPPPTDQEILQEEERKAGPTDPKTDNEAYRRQQQAEQNSSNANSGNPTNSATVSMGSLSQDAANVYVSAIVEGQTTGTCTARLTSGSQVLTKTAPLGLVTNYYACQGFTVPKSEFPTKGVWDVKIEFVNGSTTGSTSTQKITVQ